MNNKFKIEIEVLRLYFEVVRIVEYKIKSNNDVNSNFISFDNDDSFIKILGNNKLPNTLIEKIPYLLRDTILRVSKEDKTIMLLGNNKINEILSCNGLEYVLNIFKELNKFINELEYSCNISSYDIE